MYCWCTTDRNNKSTTPWRWIRMKVILLGGFSRENSDSQGRFEMIEYIKTGGMEEGSVK